MIKTPPNPADCYVNIYNRFIWHNHSTNHTQMSIAMMRRTFSSHTGDVSAVGLRLRTMLVLG
jgi:hypothetical protein